jgi:hypothetical protein
MAMTLRRQVAKDAIGALVRWRAACAEQAAPDNTKPIDPATIRQWGEELNLNEDPILEFEADCAAIERVERLEIAVKMLDQEAEKTLKPFKSREALAAAIAKAEEDLQKLRAVEGELFGIDCTRGHERNAAMRARLDAPRIYGS